MNPDVVIIGAGIVGLSVAAALAPHRRVVVVERARQPGSEATSQNAAMVRTMGEDPFERALAVRTEELLVAAEARGDGAAPLSRRTGAVLTLARDPHHLHDAAAHLRARRVRVERCDRPAEIAPALAGAAHLASWYLPDARVADPHAILADALATLKQHGGELRCGERVTALRTHAGRATGIDTERGEISSDEVVIAAGAWSAQLAAQVGLVRPLWPLRRSLVQTAPHALSALDHPWVWVDDLGVYARPEGGGWLGSPCDETIAWPSDAQSTAPLEPLARAHWMDKLERHIPALLDVRPTGGWSGLRTFAPDRRPVLGADHELSGLWWAAGMGGFGVSCSLGVGEAMAAWMIGRELRWIGRAGVSTNRPLPRRWAIRETGDVHGSTWAPGTPPELAKRS
jgi:glycine/D-amino acid oxidase-like deaminating enzyme